MNTYKLSASVLAMGAAGALPAQAQSTPTGFTLDVKGGYAMGGSLFYDKLEEQGAPDEFIDDKLGFDSLRGGYGSARFTRSISEWNDYSVGISGTFIGGSGSTDEDKLPSFVSADFEETFTGFTLDADYGWKRRFGGADIRAFAGLRAGWYSTEFSGREEVEKIPGDPDEFEKITSVDFLGFGPRVGVEARQRLAGQKYGWFAGMTAAALRGNYEAEFRGEENGMVVVDEDESFSGTMYTLDAELGVDYYVNESSKFTVGYRAEQLWNIIPDEFDSDARDKLVHGPFVGYTTSF